MSGRRYWPMRSGNENLICFEVELERCEHKRDVPHPPCCRGCCCSCVVTKEVFLFLATRLNFTLGRVNTPVGVLARSPSHRAPQQTPHRTPARYPSCSNVAANATPQLSQAHMKYGLANEFPRRHVVTEPVEANTAMMLP